MLTKLLQRHLDWLAGCNLDLWLAALGLGATLYAVGYFLSVYNQVMPKGIPY